MVGEDEMIMVGSCVVHLGDQAMVTSLLTILGCGDHDHQNELIDDDGTDQELTRQ